jgi:hypothetical protein
MASRDNELNLLSSPINADNMQELLHSNMHDNRRRVFEKNENYITVWVFF